MMFLIPIYKGIVQRRLISIIEVLFIMKNYANSNLKADKIKYKEMSSQKKGEGF